MKAATGVATEDDMKKYNVTDLRDACDGYTEEKINQLMGDKDIVTIYDIDRWSISDNDKLQLLLWVASQGTRIRFAMTCASEVLPIWESAHEGDLGLSVALEDAVGAEDRDDSVEYVSILSNRVLERMDVEDEPAVSNAMFSAAWAIYMIAPIEKGDVRYQCQVVDYTAAAARYAMRAQVTQLSDVEVYSQVQDHRAQIKRSQVDSLMRLMQEEKDA